MPILSLHLHLVGRGQVCITIGSSTVLMFNWLPSMQAERRVERRPYPLPLPVGP